MNLKKIADICHVSVSTVSRALNNAYDVSPQTREQILKVAHEQGYFAAKKQVNVGNRRRVETVAILCPEIVSPYYAKMATGFIRALSAEGCRGVIYDCGFDQKVTTDLVRRLSEDRVTDAIVALRTLSHDFSSASIPVIDYGKQPSHIEVNRRRMFDLMVEHLLKKGFQTILFAGETLTSERWQIFCQAAQKKGVFPRLFVSEKRFENAGHDAAEHLLQSGEKLPDCIVCAYDEIACGLIQTLAENGVRVPEDVSVIGVNNSPQSAYCFGGLSTVDEDVTDAARQIVHDLVTKPVAYFREQRVYTVQTRLIIRHT